MDEEQRVAPFLMQLRVLAPLLALATAFRILPFHFFTPDDTYIYLRFVQNLLESGEPAFNAGEPTYGFTSSLWMLLLAAGGWLTGDALAWGKVLSFLFAIAGPPVVMLLVERWTGERALGLLAGLAWAADAWSARWSMSALEASLSALIPVLVLLLAARAREEGRESPLAALIAAIGPLVRPEMIGFWLLYVMHAFVAGGGSLRGRTGRLLKAALPGATILVASGYATWAAFGRLLPNTAEAKGTMQTLLGGLVPAALRIAKILASTQAIWGLVIVVALVVLARRVPWRQLLDEDDRGWVLAGAWVTGLVGLYVVQGVTVYTRYLLPIMPVIVAAGVGLTYHLWQRGGLQRTLVMWLALAAIAQSMVLDIAWIRPGTQTYQRSEREVPIHIGRWLAENTRPETRVAVPDIGAIGYYSRRYIVDMNALVTPSLIPAKRDGKIYEALAEDPPDYIIDIHSDPRHLEGKVADLELRAIMSRPFHKMFLTQDEPLWYSMYEVLGPADDSLIEETPE